VHYEVDGENDKFDILDLVEKTQSTNLKNECLGALCIALTIIKDKVCNVETAGNSKAKKYAHLFLFKILKH
jgi:hypothetical protein